MRMKVVFVTIVLDGLPWIASHYPMMRSLTVPWEWHVVEGVADNKNCTSWCHSLTPRLSNDGTTQYLDSLQFDRRVRLYRKQLWNGKIEMVNAPLAQISEECLLWQIDSDEMWRADQIERMRRLFLACPERTSAHFYCRYFVGPDIIIKGRGVFGNYDYDWERVWRFSPGMKFQSHEPPKIIRPINRPFTQQETADEGLVFDHFAYATQSAVAFKEKYYGTANHGNGIHYRNAVQGWSRLQNNNDWPVKNLASFLPWVGKGVEAVRI